MNTSHAGGHGRIPAEVGSDPALSHRDVRVYYALALFEREGVANAGLQLIARAARTFKSKASDSIAKLVKFGHIEKLSTARGKRGEYKILAPLFSRKKESATSLKHCAECKRECRSLHKTGLCGMCRDRANIRRLEAAAYRVLGDGASQDQVNAHVGAAVLAVVRRAERKSAGVAGAA